ncbi:MAG: hypothetical protein IT262_05265, partial [Saprospiraceae bacterium]|nr:hypothetical protein [Saprospiraceae bacterium]
MKNLRNLFLAVLAMVSMTLTSCLHILEEVTFKDKGNGSYAMTLDMSELKGMMDMMKGMTGDSLSGDSTAIMSGDAPAAEPAVDNSMSQMGEQLSSVAASLKGIEGINNVVEVNDTANLKFGYTFDFADVAALNRALKIINKDKYDSKTDEIFKFSGKNFERLGAGDLGEEIKKALAEGGGEEEGGEESMDMMKMMFADMSYTQVYHFPDREIKKSDNSLAALSDDNH